MNAELLGLVPLITPEEIAALAPEERKVISMIFDGPNDSPMARREELDQPMLIQAMAKLGVHSIWGKEGLIVYRLRVGDRIAVAGIAPDPAKSNLPLAALERKWVECTDLNNLAETILAAVASAGKPVQVLPEDHPELQSIGFISPELNTVWLITTAAVEASITAPANYSHVNNLIQSNQGRIELGLRMATGKLMSAAEFMAAYEGVAARTPDAGPVLAARDFDISIDLMAGKIADRYKARYLTPMRAAAPAPAAPEAPKAPAKKAPATKAAPKKGRKG